jgi:hypothetical protein
MVKFTFFVIFVAFFAGCLFCLSTTTQHMKPALPQLRSGQVGRAHLREVEASGESWQGGGRRAAVTKTYVAPGMSAFPLSVLLTRCASTFEEMGLLLISPLPLSAAPIQNE